MSPCLYVSMSPYLHVSMSPCLHVSMSPCLYVSVSPCLHVSMSPSPCLHVSGILQTENGSNGKRHLPFVFCKRKTEMANLRLFAANGNGKRLFVFLSRQTINCNRRLLFQKMCPSVHLKKHLSLQKNKRITQNKQ